MNGNKTEEVDPFNPIQNPMYLYDLILGLESENPERVDKCLKNGEKLIRSKLPDLEPNCEKLCKIYMQIINQFDFDDFDINVTNSLVALLSLYPKKVLKHLIDRVESPNCSLGQIFQILDVIKLSVKELSGFDNKNKNNNKTSKKKIQR